MERFTRLITGKQTKSRLQQRLLPDRIESKNENLKIARTKRSLSRGRRCSKTWHKLIPTRMPFPLMKIASLQVLSSLVTSMLESLPFAAT